MRVKLCDICDFQGGSQPPKEQWAVAPQKGYIRMLQIRDFTQKEKTIPEYIKISNSTKTCLKDDILIARYGASVGKILTGLEGAYNVAIMKTIPDEEKISKKFLYYFLLSSGFQNSILNVASRAAQAGFNKDDLQSIFLECPSLQRQMEICNILDKVCDLIALRRKQLERLDLMVKARFVEMFGDPLDESVKQLTMPMTDLCDIIDGDRGKMYPKSDEFEKKGFCLFLNAKNVTEKGFCFDSCFFVTEKKDKELRKGKLLRGEIVLTTRGTIGNLALYDEAVPFEHIRINSGMAILRLRKDIILETFFIKQFRMLLNMIKEKIVSGSAQPQLPISTMNKIRMIVPDIKAQQTFSTFVAEIDKLKLPIQRSLDTLEVLKKSLMQEYFG